MSEQQFDVICLDFGIFQKMLSEMNQSTLTSARKPFLGGTARHLPQNMHKCTSCMNTSEDEAVVQSFIGTKTDVLPLQADTKVVTYSHSIKLYYMHVFALLETPIRLFWFIHRVTLFDFSSFDKISQTKIIRRKRAIFSHKGKKSI